MRSERAVLRQTAACGVGAGNGGSTRVAVRLREACPYRRIFQTVIPAKAGIQGFTEAWL
jgi:hypothetical protein